MSDMLKMRKAFSSFWIFPVLVPLGLILFSYLFLKWDWGLMDDFQLLDVPGGMLQRTQVIFNSYLGFGELKWTHAVHSAFFYKTFSSSPGFFYILKWAEIAVMLFVWGLAARQLTGRRVVVFLVPAIALSFHYIYDQFFFLSAQETIGLLFLGMAVWCGIRILTLSALCSSHLCVRLWLAAWVCFLLALGAKETFVACGVALGAAIACAGWFFPVRKKRFVWIGFGWLAISLLYGVVLKLFVSSAYTAGYNFLDTVRITHGFRMWMLKDAVNHLPWLVASGVLLAVFRRKSDLKGSLLSAREKWGILLGGFLYAGFFLVLLPWNTTSYYASPFGVFFAFSLAIFLAPCFEAVSIRLMFFLLVFSTGFNMFVAQYALVRESAYHQNTQDFWQWMRGNLEFQRASGQGKVYCDAAEPSHVIPGHVSRYWALELKAFVYQPDILQSSQAGAEYFVHSSRFGSPPDVRGWSTVFYSQYWQVYRKQGL